MPHFQPPETFGLMAEGERHARCSHTTTTKASAHNLHGYSGNMKEGHPEAQWHIIFEKQWADSRNRAERKAWAMTRAVGKAALPASRGSLHPLAHGPFLQIQNWQRSILFDAAASFSLFLVNILIITLAHTHNPGQHSHLKMGINLHCCKPLRFGNLSQHQ